MSENTNSSTNAQKFAVGQRVRVTNPDAALNGKTGTVNLYDEREGFPYYITCDTPISVGDYPTYTVCCAESELTAAIDAPPAPAGEQGEGIVLSNHDLKMWALSNVDNPAVLASIDRLVAELKDANSAGMTSQNIWLDEKERYNSLYKDYIMQQQTIEELETERDDLKRQLDRETSRVRIAQFARDNETERYKQAYENYIKVARFINRVAADNPAVKTEWDELQKSLHQSLNEGDKVAARVSMLASEKAALIAVNGRLERQLAAAWESIAEAHQYIAQLFDPEQRFNTSKQGRFVTETLNFADSALADAQDVVKGATPPPAPDVSERLCEYCGKPMSITNWHQVRFNGANYVECIIHNPAPAVDGDLRAAVQPFVELYQSWLDRPEHEIDERFIDWVCVYLCSKNRESFTNPVYVRRWFEGVYEAAALKAAGE